MNSLLRILTANLFNGTAAIGSLRRVLEDEQPHVAVFQEMDPAQARIVEQHFPYGRLDPRRDNHGMGIAATHPVDVERFAMTHRDGWLATLPDAAWPRLDRDVEVLNVHVQNPLMRPLRETSRNRKGQVSDILDHVAVRRMARVVLGDFNSTPTWRLYKRLAEHLQDASVAADTAKSTWAYFSWMPRFLRIDHAFVEGLVVVGTHTARIRGSDHSALVVDVSTE